MIGGPGGGRAGEPVDGWLGGPRKRGLAAHLAPGPEPAGGRGGQGRRPRGCHKSERSGFSGN